MCARVYVEFQIPESWHDKETAVLGIQMMNYEDVLAGIVDSVVLLMSKYYSYGVF